MKRILASMLLIFCLLPSGQVSAASDPNDHGNGKDPELFSRMPGFYIYNYEELESDQYDFPVGPLEIQTIKGHYYYLDYFVNEDVTPPSGLQIVRSYMDSVKAIGGVAVYTFEDEDTQYATLKVVKDGTESWAVVEAGNNGMYKIHVVEKQLAKPNEAANAASLASSIQKAGRAVVYGIHFDTGKSDLKPESDPAIGEIAKLLGNEPDLKLYVVGHTDNTGTFDSNLSLSQARAKAVIDALVGKHKIPASRLIPFGAGPTSPLASNDTEVGRAENRRVELVAQ